MATRAKLFSQLAKSVDTSGTLNTTALNGSLGITMYDSVGQLPTSGNTAGDQAFVNATNRLYIWDGSGWYSVGVTTGKSIAMSIVFGD